jgi:hypothetical protein
VGFDQKVSMGRVIFLEWTGLCEKWDWALGLEENIGPGLLFEMKFTRTKFVFLKNRRTNSVNLQKYSARANSANLEIMKD